MSITLSDAGDIVNELGSERFPWSIKKWLSRHATLPAIYHSIAMCYDSVPAPTHNMRRFHQVSSLFSASDIAPDLVLEALDLYTRHGEWRQDELISRLERKSTADMRIEQIPPPAAENARFNPYLQLFNYSQLGIEYALTLTDEHRVYTYSLFQKRGDLPFSANALRGLSIYGPFILTLLRKHAQFTLRSRPNLSTPQQQFSARLSGCGVKLSAREYETCLGVLNGENITQLAQRMQVKETSVRTYLDRALIKLHLSGKRALYQWSIAGQQSEE